MVVLAEPGEEPLEDVEAFSLGGDRERLVLGIAVAVDRPLVGLQDGFGDGGGISEPALLGPAQEGFECPAVGLQRAFGKVSLPAVFHPEVGQRSQRGGS